MLSFLSSKEEAFGLDIADFSINIVKLDKKGSHFRLSSFNNLEIGSQPLRDGELKNEKFLADLIRKAVVTVKGRPLKTKYVVASLPEEKAFLQVIQMPRIGQEKLEKAVVFEMENYIPMKKEDVYLDFQIVKPVVDSLDHYDILIAAFPKKIIDSYFKILKSAGLRPIAVETESQSVARAIIKNGLSPGRTFIIDIGRTRTRFIMFVGYDIRLTSSVPFGARTFSDLLVKILDVSQEQAKKLQIEAGLSKRVKIKPGSKHKKIEAEPGKIFEALVPAAIDLLEQTQRFLNFYISCAGHEHLPLGKESATKIFLCGEGAYLKDLDIFLSEQLGQDVTIANPLVNMGDSKRSFKIPSSQVLKYTTALGLALRGAGYD